MSGALSISTRRAYGVQRVCRVWHCARSSVYARRQATLSPAPCRRRGPIGAAPDDVLVAHIRRVLEASPFYGEGYRKAWAKLRVEGVRTSKERVRRLMREHDLQAPQRTGHAHGPKAHDGTITTEAPDVMWGTDMTATVTVAEGAAFVFVAVDHWATECIGLHAAKSGNRFEALEPIRQGIRERFRGIGEGVARGLRLRHDHGSNGSVARFGITRENPLGGPRYAANPNTLWISCVCPTTSPFAIHRACPLRSACMISMPRKVRHAVVNRLKPSIGRVRRLMNRWSCSMMLFRYLHWRRFERGRTSPSCRTASNATG